MLRVPAGIASEHRAPREWFPAVAVTIAVALSLPCLAGADVRVKQKTVSEGLGGFGNATVEGSLVVSGDRSRSEDHVTYTGRFKTFVGSKPTESVSITRLDKDLVWSLDPAKKEYSELTFAEMRAMMEKGSEEMQKATPAQDEGMKFTVDVKKTGAKQDVNGFACEQVVITCSGKPTDPKQAAEIQEVRMTMDQWMTQKAPGNAEMTAYYKKFAEKLGREAGMAQMAEAARRMYGNGMQEMTGKLKDLEGFPIRSTLTIENVLSAENQQKLAEAQKEAAAAQANAEKEMAQAKTERADQEKKQDAEDAKSVGTAIGKGGFGGALGGFLGKKANKAASKKAEAAAETKVKEMAESGGPAAGGPMFKSVTEILSISTEAAPAGSFEVPAGYSQKKK